MLKSRIAPATLIVLTITLLLAPAAWGQYTDNTIYTFTGSSDGSVPGSGSLVMDSSGNLYGTTKFGGDTTSANCGGGGSAMDSKNRRVRPEATLAVTTGCGVVFKLTPAASGPWTETILYTFAGGTDGANPQAGVILDSLGNLYGTTTAGGSTTACASKGCGTVFKLTKADGAPWAESILYSFSGGTDGSSPEGGVVFDATGTNLYGTTELGGITGTGCEGCGVVFKLAPAASGPWTETVLYSFGSAESSTDGFFPVAGVTFDASGNLYGTTDNGGSSFSGVVYKLTPAASGPWTETVLHSFTGGSDGYAPDATVIFDTAGNLYSTTTGGGNTSDCGGNGCGVVFKLTPAASGPWPETVLYAFTGSTDGAVPSAGVVFDAAGNVYSTANSGGNTSDCTGNGGCGVVFELLAAASAPWTENVLYTFTGGDDGGQPGAGLIFDSALNLYGTTTAGGADTDGVVFELSPPVPIATTTTLASNINPSNFDETVTFTATVTVTDTGVFSKLARPASLLSAAVAAPTGTVAFTANGATITGCSAVTVVSSGTAQCPTSALPVGTNPIVATYSGDTNYAGSASSALPQVVEVAPTTTAVASSSNPSTFDQAVTFTATVSVESSGVARGNRSHSRLVSPQVPTGTVAFTANGTTITGCNAVTLTSSDTAQCTTSALPVGTSPIVATYSGDTNYAGSASSALAQVVEMAVTTTTVASSLNPSSFDQAVTFTATVALNVPIAEGRHPSRFSQVFPQVPTGTVAFTANGTTITGCGAVTLSSSGTAQCATSALPVGTDAIVGTYSGDSNYAGSSGDLSQVVTTAATATAVVSSLNPSIFDEAVTFTATIATAGSGVKRGQNPRSALVLPQTPTGTVAFTSNGITISGCSAVTLSSSGTAQCTTSALPVGTDAIVGTYSGDSDYSGSSGDLSQVVTQVTTATVLASNLNPSTVGQSVTFTASITPTTATGAVGFTSNGTTISGCAAATVASGQAACTTSFPAAGTYLIVASYSGDTNNAGSASSTLSEVVNPAATTPTTTSMASSLNPSGFGQAVTFTATVTPEISVVRRQAARFSPASAGTPTGTMAFTSNGTSITGCSAVTLNASGAAECATTALAVGTDSMVATYSGDTNYSGSSGDLSQLVNPASSATALTSSVNPSVVAQPVTFTAAVKGSSPTGTVGFTSNGTAISGCSAVTLASGSAQCTTSFATAGTYAIVATYSGDSNNVGSSGDLSQVVSVSAPHLEVTATPSALTVTGGSTGTVKLVVSVSGSVSLSSAVAFACKGLPSDASCSFSPASVTDLPATVTMTISTTSADAQLRRTGRSTWAFFAMILPGLLLLPGGRREIRRLRKAKWLLLGLALLLAVSLVGCCGTATNNVVGVQSKSYPVTVTASSPGATAGTASVTLTVCNLNGC